MKQIPKNFQITFFPMIKIMNKLWSNLNLIKQISKKASLASLKSQNFLGLKSSAETVLNRF